MKNFGIWLADSPFGGLFKAALGASLVWTLDNLASLNLPSTVTIALGSLLPIAINYFNSQDLRYGKADLSQVSD